jgi:2-amino-4-hydroxy-6-hydroxymethyldihydropteridine diphosphokinase
VSAVSSFRSTAPVGYLDQPRFTNAAALLETDLGPLPLLRELLAIERAMGRDRGTSPAKGPRVIDLDLLLYSGEGHPAVLHDPDLILPHPAMHERRFVLEPLAEIAPGLVHPVLEKTIARLLAELMATA